MSEIAKKLREFNQWRRGAECEQPHPTAIGVLLDDAANRLELLERESKDFFDSWHKERARCERLVGQVLQCYEILITEPHTKVALFKAEDILRIALAERELR